MSDITYSLFYDIEQEVRHHLAPTMNVGFKDNLITISMNSEEVLFQWSMCATEIDSHTGEELLKLMVELYVKIRGFSFATTCVEKYKRAHKKLLQKGKVYPKRSVYINCCHIATLTLFDIIKTVQLYGEGEPHEYATPTKLSFLKTA